MTTVDTTAESGGGDGERDPETLLGGLAHRLGRGFGTVLNEGRENLARTHDEPALSEPVLAAALLKLTNAHSDGTGLTRAHDALTACWDEHPEVVRVLLHRPVTFLDRLPELLAGTGPSAPAAAPALGDGEGWRVFAACADLLWDYLNRDTPHTRKHRHLAPLAARTRFLALSEPFRHPDDQVWSDLRATTGALYRIFGHGTWPEPARRAQEARETWRNHLNGHQSIPLFDHAPPTAVEDEVRSLALVPATGFSGDPLVLAAPSAPGSAGDERTVRERARAVPPAERALLEEVVEQHLLPRFATGRVWAIALGLRRTHPPAGQAVVFAMVAVCAAGALACTVWALFDQDMPLTIGLGLAAATYVLIGAGTLWFGRLWAMPLMLRLPAAAAVGLIVLVALHPDWWTNIRPGPDLSTLLALLGGVSFGYLLIEARNHNSGQFPQRLRAAAGPLARITGRALSVTLTGLVHASLVALLGMAVIAPVFSEEGPRLTTAWTGEEQGAGQETGEPAPETADTPEPTEDTAAPPQEPPRQPGEPWAILAAATFWCLAAGVFSQILWDDQPITAPLAHRRWRNER
ncbi:hypothetical protein [Nocardiopsis lambiniae]|uniref:Uncharacterized protein n=1 Tax=Nocardiopsis lambiniae TaxID=3075539 RepID=A0ABU2M2V8_9ACTN|nr:hypothetical protein [Nocardiopsis sp. DSM 44743]MDT0326985.1 hypothetical protein [Nocardiopsis sp. DSM 44743]